MCGIIAAFNTKQKGKAESVNDFIINQYEDQHERGNKGFGIIRISKNSIEIDRSTEPYKFLMDLQKNKSSMMIVHHRYPTSTQNKISQTHPILVSNKILSHDYLLIHNGIINNEEELKEQHEKIGFKYQTELTKEEIEKQDKKYTYYQRGTFNDSESIAIEMALYIEELSQEIKAKGSMAFIALQIDKKTKKPLKVFFGRNKGNPLNMHKEKNILRLSSEGIGEEIKESILYSFKISDKTMKLSEEELKFVQPAISTASATFQNSLLETIKTETSTNTKKTEGKKETEDLFDPINYFKDSIKDKTIEEIESITEETLEANEEEIYNIMFSLRNELLTETNVKTGDYKRQICELIDGIKDVTIAAQAEIAIDKTSKRKTEEQEFINWSKGNYDSKKTYEEETYDTSKRVRGFTPYERGW